MPKRPPSNERVPSPDRGSLTDEWGIYDPAKAGMQALYARLGRPVLRESAKKARLESRRGFRPERPNDGVGLAIQEAMVRAGVFEPKEDEGTAVSPAQAVRIALKAARPPKAEAAMSQVTTAAQDLAACDAPKRRPTRRAKSSTSVTAAVATAPSAVEVSSATQIAEIEPAPKARAPRKAKPRAKAELQAVAAAPVVPGPPAPSPRRPRGPVPLAAWAHAVTDTPKPEARRGDKRGFWKGLFRMPADVALVEYAHGCRIHRLLIETSEDAPLLDLL